MTAINSNRAIRGPVTAVPVVAGKGVRLTADTDNNRWVVEADETVLWDGEGTALSTATLDESIYNFEYLRLELYIGAGNIQAQVVKMEGSPTYISCGGITTEANTYVTYVFACSVNVSNSGTTLTVPQKGNGFAILPAKTISYFQNNNFGTIRRIIGVNRIASA